MTVTAIPALTARPRLAPYTAASGDMVLPGCYGVSRGEGITGDLIRHAPGVRPGHAFIYIGNGRIVEVAPPAAVYGASLGRAVMAGMAVTVIGLPRGVLAGFPVSPEGAAIMAADTSRFASSAPSLRRRPRPESTVLPSGYLRYKQAPGLLAACNDASVPPWQRTGGGM